MLLTIDCGNTNTVFSIWDGTAFIATWRTATEHQRTADQYFVWLSSLMNLRGVQADITDVIVSSTVPRVVFNLRVLADRYFNTRPLVVGKPDCQLPIDVRVDAGTSVGPDRLVNTVAGHDLFGGNLIIVDFGTATTFDVVDADGAYIGGVIAPGVNLAGPTLAGLATRAQQTLDSPGYEGEADSVEGYIRESIVSPSAYLHPGEMYSAEGVSFMPNGYGESLTDEQVDQLVQYLASFK